MATVPYLTISDGTTTITFADGAAVTPGDYSYDQNGWAPGVAFRTGDEISVDGPYGAVPEEIEIYIRGANASTLYGNVQALERLLDQAQRWNQGDRTVNPVRIRYIPGGSAKTVSNYYEALLLDTAEPMLVLPKSWSKASPVLMVTATLKLRRRGLWLNETDTQSAATQPSGTLMTATFGTTHPQLSPVRIDLALGSTAAGAYTVQVPPQILIVAPSADIHIQEAETYTSTPGGTGAFAPAAGELARGGSVWRYVAGGAGGGDGPVYQANTLLPILQAEGQFAVFAVCRATVDNWRIKGVYYHVDNTTTGGVSMPEQSLLAGYQVVSLGIINAAPDNGIAALQFIVNAPAASTFTIDYFVVVKLSEAASILAINTLFTSPSGYPASTAIRESIIPDLATRRAPIVGLTNNADTLKFSIGASGDRVPYESGTAMAALWLACAAASYRIDTNAITSSAAAGTLLSVVATFNRRRAYLVPE